jgi:hypothetical protein
LVTSLGFDLGSAVGGFVVGFVFGAIVLTATGRQVSGEVARATGERLKYHITPK